MTFRARMLVLLISVPVILLIVVGGVLSRAMPRTESYQHLRVFDDVVSLVMNNYVEQVETEKIMTGAMQGLAEGLDADSAWLTPAEVATLTKQPAGSKGTIGVELTRQVLPARHRRARWLASRTRRSQDRRFRPRHRRQADARDVGLRGNGAPQRRAGEQSEAHGDPRQRGRAARRRGRP